MSVITKEMIQETKSKLPSILSDIKDKKKVVLEDVLAQMLIIMIGENSEQSKKIKALETKCNDLATKVKKLECQQYQTRVVFRNVPINPNVRGRNAKETPEQTRESVIGVCEAIGVDSRTIGYAKRIPLPVTANKDRLPIISVIFNSLKDKSDFFANISKLGDHDQYGSVNVEGDVPPSLIPEAKLARNKAYDLRQKNFKTRLAINYFTGQIILLAKKPKGTTFDIQPRDTWFKEDDE